VSLSSGAAAFPVPASVVIPGGASGGVLSVRTTAVTASASVTVTATYNSATKTASVTLNPVAPPNLTAVAIAPSSVTGGSGAILVVTLGGPAPAGGASVSLSSDNAAFPVPASVTVPEGAKGADLFVQTKAVTASTEVTVTAAYNKGSETASVTLKPPSQK
jgi:Na+/proline symporter